jgi:YidC/Oxa1 family membrane protein insertase
MEERRLLTALALSILVMTAWGYLFSPKAGAPRPTPAPSVAAGSSGGAAQRPPEASPEKSPAAPEASEPRPPALSDERERRVEVSSEHAVVAFSNRGARLVSWQLSRQRDARGRGEEMVPAARSGPRPLDLETQDPAVDARLREALFQPSAEQQTVPVDGEAELTFAWAEGDLEVLKTLRFTKGGALVEVGASVKRAGRELPIRLLWGPGLSNPTAADKDVQGYLPPQGVVRANGKVERLPATSLAEDRRFGSVRFIGVESHYFAALMAPPAGGAAELRRWKLPPEDGQEQEGVVAAIELAGAPVVLFVGAKDYHALSPLGHDFASVVDVGDWIGPIVVPLLSLLRWVHAHVGNYGWSIVFLTVVINLVMAPLRHYSIANGIRMAKVAPEIRVIQERYRKVPLSERGPMNDEVSKVYARHGMNMGTQMMVGCLPMLLTLPFLIAFYRVLQVSIELKGASFLWIPDLAQKDPLLVTPILMGASMVLMQKLTPAGTMDPAQQKMMMLMPVVLTVMFVAAPAGLNLYWLASNLCSIVQQGVTLNMVKGREQAVAQPAPAARERKKK